MIEPLFVELRKIPSMTSENFGKLIVSITPESKVATVCRISQTGDKTDYYFYPKSKTFFINGQICNQERFTTSLGVNYTDDFEWLLWNSEVLKGDWNG